MLSQSVNPELRKTFANQIHQQLTSCKINLQKEFRTGDRIPSCHIDDLLREEDAKALYQAFPNPSEMLPLRDLREHKYVGIQMDQFNPLLEEIIYAFQAPEVVQLISEITGIEPLLPDESLYAGGISLMRQGCFLNPHLDNSHDKDRKNYRVLNLLYYVTPDWQPEYGGNLELWDQGLKRPCRIIHSKFNRLVLMATDRASWHSVSRVVHDGQRCCVSNYYFSPKPLETAAYFHVTSFRGRPEQPLRDMVLQGDAALRNGIRKVFKHGVHKPHYYQK